MYIEDKELDGQLKDTRRSFLGSVIGLFTAVNLGWVAAEPKAKPIELPKDCLPDWKNYICLTNGIVIQGSGIKDIDKGKLILHDIMATQTLDVKGSLILYKDKPVSNMNFAYNQCLLNGDILRITHGLNLTLPDDKTVITPEHPDWDFWVNRRFSDLTIIEKYAN